MWEAPHGMSKRRLGAMFLAVLILVCGCGGGGDGTPRVSGGDSAPRVTLTDKSCTYSGARTHEPGVFEVQTENTTSHVASFAVYELAPGFSIKDVRGVAHDRGETNVKPPTPDDFRWNEAWSHAGPRATTHLPVNVSARRLVIVCMENPSADTRPSSDSVWPNPVAIYVPTQLQIR